MPHPIGCASDTLTHNIHVHVPCARVQLQLFNSMLYFVVDMCGAKEFMAKAKPPGCRAPKSLLK